MDCPKCPFNQSLITQLTTLKARLAIDAFDVTHDGLLTNAIVALSARFDRERNRTLARTVGFTDEFPAQDLEIIPSCYPVETVTKFEIKNTEAEGWLEQTSVDYLIRRNCIISFQTALATQSNQLSIARVTYTGGYVLPGTSASAGQTPFPSDLEQAAVEQLAYWFQHRDKLGLVRLKPNLGTLEQFADPDLLPSTAAIVSRYVRYNI